MRGNELLDKMELVDAAYVEAADKVPEPRKRNKRKSVAMIACAAVILIVGGLVLMQGLRPVSPGYDITELEVVQKTDDRVVYNTFMELAAGSDLVVIGEYACKTRQDTDPDRIRPIATNEIKVLKVLKGDVRKGDRLPVSQSYEILAEEQCLITFSELTPMEKGERWIFFLLKGDLSDMYWCNGDSDGRYPLPDEEILGLMQDYKVAVDALSALLWEQEMVAPRACEEIETNGGCVYGDDSGRCYVISEEDEERFYALLEERQSVQNRVDEEKFGVYDGGRVKLQIYWDILNVYDLSIE